MWRSTPTLCPLSGQNVGKLQAALHRRCSVPQRQDAPPGARTSVAMNELRVHRRLVKSPPELWAEVSDQDTLRRHLDLFGEIRIARVDPESTVAWEGERASGTVVLETAGWGTKVTLTAAVGGATLPAPPPAPGVDGSVPAEHDDERTAGGTTPVAATEWAGGPAVVMDVAAPREPEPSTAGSARRALERMLDALGGTRRPRAGR